MKIALAVALDGALVPAATCLLASVLLSLAGLYAGVALVRVVTS